MPPLCSILLPARDAVSTLPCCLSSIARQHLSDFECVVVDDHSRDATAELLAAWRQRDARFVPIANPGAGLIDALQHGLRHCRGQFIARMDADDVMHRDRLSLQVEALRRQPALSGVGCRVRLFPTAAIGAGMTAYARWLNAIATADDVRREAFVESPIVHPTLLLRGAVARAFGWRDVPWPEDYDLLLRLLQQGHDLAVLSRRLLAWRRGPRTLTVTDPRYGAERFFAAKAAFLASGFLRGAPGYVLWGFGGTGRALRRELLRHGLEMTHLIERHPRRLGQCIHGAAVLRPEQLAELPHRHIVVSVAGAANRALIRAQLAAMGRVELVDFVCAA
jgi:glycosyltransferase involved in cell wall biosynthesis